MPSTLKRFGAWLLDRRTRLLTGLLLSALAAGVPQITYAQAVVPHPTTENEIRATWGPFAEYAGHTWGSGSGQDGVSYKWVEYGKIIHSVSLLDPDSVSLRSYKLIGPGRIHTDLVNSTSPGPGSWMQLQQDGKTYLDSSGRRFQYERNGNTMTITNMLNSPPLPFTVAIQSSERMIEANTEYKKSVRRSNEQLAEEIRRDQDRRAQWDEDERRIQAGFDAHNRRGTAERIKSIVNGDAAASALGLPTAAERETRRRADAEVARTLNSRVGSSSSSTSSSSSISGRSSSSAGGSPGSGGSQSSDGSSAYASSDDSDQSTSSTSANSSASSGSSAARNSNAGSGANVGLIVKERDRAAEARAAAESERESAAKAAAYAVVRAKEASDRAAFEAQEAAFRAAQAAKAAGSKYKCPLGPNATVTCK